MTTDREARRDALVAAHVAALDELLDGVEDVEERHAIRGEYYASMSDGDLDDAMIHCEVAVEQLRRMNAPRDAERRELLSPRHRRLIALRARAEELALDLDDDDFERWISLPTASSSATGRR